MTIYELEEIVEIDKIKKYDYQQISMKLIDIAKNSLLNLSDRRYLLQVLYSLILDLNSRNTVRPYLHVSDFDGYKQLETDIHGVSELIEYFGTSFVDVTQIDWDLLEPSSTEVVVPAKQIPTVVLSDLWTTVEGKKSRFQSITPSGYDITSASTGKEDLYLVTPTYPKLTSLLAINTLTDTGEVNQMCQSAPVIPTKQSEITITTDPRTLTDRELYGLYPKNVIQTRHATMYERIDGVDFDDDLGLIIPILGYSTRQLKANLIEYPHLYQIKRCVGNDYGKPIYEPFERHIEIDGQLVDTEAIWDRLPDARMLPNARPFWKEYVIRRYLLERDIHGIDHIYPIVGDLNKFLTLFAPTDFYRKWGYLDLLELARSCVASRISFKSSRNGVVKNRGIQDCVFAPYCFDIECSSVCPKKGQHSYLMQLNDLKLPLPFLDFTDSELEKGLNILRPEKWFVCVQCTDPPPGQYAKFLTYLAICNQWKGSAASAVVYHLNFAKYVDEMTTSSPWAPSDLLQYMRIWSRGESCIKNNKAHTLIISGLDYINFNDKCSAELLQLITDRERPNFKTVVVTSGIRNLIGKDALFSRLTTFLKGGVER